MKVNKQEHDEQLALLRKWLKPGETVYTILRHVSYSGMMRHISVVLIKRGRKEPITLHPNYAVSQVLGYPLVNGSRDAVKVGGCGMDVGFELVYNLGKALWPNGTKKPHGTRNGEPDSDGGYALKHRWL